MNKAYPQFNLKTLQLPAPASNMTKAEYKEAYGIDLDDVNIKAFKLVLFGNEKYPIDQIKEVEDGYEIYFNGRILSVTDTIQTSNEVYDVANAKPLYYHPITMWAGSGAIRGTLSCLIVNNSPTAYTKDTFISAIADFARICPLSGAIIFGSTKCVLSYSYLSADKHVLYGYDLDAGSDASVNDLESFVLQSSITFNDNVNRIN